MTIKFTYQQKIRLLPWLLVACLFIIYLVAINETVKVKSNCKDLRSQILRAGDAHDRLAMITARLSEISKVTSINMEDPTGDPLLNFFSMNRTSEAELIDFLPLHTCSSSPYLIETRIAVFKGSFNSLLTLLFSLEKNYPSGKVVSVKFETEVNIKTEEKSLRMTLYIQSISNDKEEVNNPKS